jgi:hypothetical protein
MYDNAWFISTIWNNKKVSVSLLQNVSEQASSKRRGLSEIQSVYESGQTLKCAVDK